jgi:L-2-hydroxyglutarate oxidase LhgO
MIGSNTDERIGVIGAGIVGLAVARQLLIDHPGVDVTVVDKEQAVASHQTAHNSGVLHSGVYYQPGTLKSQLCIRGARLLKEFCSLHGIAIDECGKLVIARDEEELEGLEAIRKSAEASGVRKLAVIDAAGIRDFEPEATGLRALHSPTTAILDFRAVAIALADEIANRGGQITLGRRVTRVTQEGSHVVVEHIDGADLFGFVFICAGLQSDRVAVLAGDERDPQIIPFRGEYYRLTPAKSALVRGLIYPVPDSRYPFLGVHFTRRIDGNVDIGPNAILAFAREGYRRRNVSAHDIASMLSWPGCWRMAGKHWQAGVHEMATSLSRKVFLRQAQRYVPKLGVHDLEPGPSGVRAQAVDRRGRFLDDFCISDLGNLIALRNAPSPAATSALAIAQYVCRNISLSNRTK